MDPVTNGFLGGVVVSNALIWVTTPFIRPGANLNPRITLAGFQFILGVVAMFQSHAWPVWLPYTTALAAAMIAFCILEWQRNSNKDGQPN
jgi:hypothetical protein